MDSVERGMLEKTLDREIASMKKNPEYLPEIVPHYSEKDTDAIIAGTEAYLIGYLSSHLDTIYSTQNNATEQEDMTEICDIVERRGNEIQRIVEES